MSVPFGSLQAIRPPSSYRPSALSIRLEPRRGYCWSAIVPGFSRSIGTEQVWLVCLYCVFGQLILSRHCFPSSVQVDSSSVSPPDLPFAMCSHKAQLLRSSRHFVHLPWVTSLGLLIGQFLGLLYAPHVLWIPSSSYSGLSSNAAFSEMPFDDRQSKLFCIITGFLLSWNALFSPSETRNSLLGSYPGAEKLKAGNALLYCSVLGIRYLGKTWLCVSSTLCGEGKVTLIFTWRLSWKWLGLRVQNGFIGISDMLANPFGGHFPSTSTALNQEEGTQGYDVTGKICVANFSLPHI